MYLDERGYTVLKTIVNNPAITGKEVEASLQLSRKQLSYAIEKINDYLQDNGMPKIERLRTGKFIIPVAVIEQYQTEEITGDGTTYIYTDKERGLLIFLMLLCVREELSIYHFTSKLEISKNTFLTDLKKLEQRLEEYHLEVLYSRQEGYHLVGSEYAKREMMVTSIRGILKIPRGKETIMDICQISEEMMEQVEKQISMIEERLQVRFTDERLKELPLIMCLIIIRTQKGRILRERGRRILRSSCRAVISGRLESSLAWPFFWPLPLRWISPAVSPFSMRFFSPTICGSLIRPQII